MGVTKLKALHAKPSQTDKAVPIQSKKAGSVQKRTKLRKQKQLLKKKITMRGAVKSAKKDLRLSDDDNDDDDEDEDFSSNDDVISDDDDDIEMQLDSDEASDTNVDDEEPPQKNKKAIKSKPVDARKKKSDSTETVEGKKSAKSGTVVAESPTVSDEDIALTLYVSHLKKGLTEDTLREFVASRGYAVIGCRKVVNAAFGFVQFAEKSELERALNGLAGVAFDGEPLYVAKAKPKSAKKVEDAAKKTTKKAVKEKVNKDKVTMFVKPVGPTVTKGMLETLFPGVLKVIMPRKNTGQTKGFALLRYETAEELRAAMVKHQGVKLEGRELVLDVAGNNVQPTTPAASSKDGKNATSKKKSKDSKNATTPVKKGVANSLERTPLSKKKGVVTNSKKTATMKKERGQSSASSGEVVKMQRKRSLSNENGAMKPKQQSDLSAKKKRPVRDASNDDD